MIRDLAQILWQSSDFIKNETLTESYVEDETIVTIDLPLRVILYNDNYHTFDEVISQLRKATGCSHERAEAHAWEVHTAGKSIVYDGSMGECLRVSSVLEEIALHTQILS